MTGDAGNSLPASEGQETIQKKVSADTFPFSF